MAVPKTGLKEEADRDAAKQETGEGFAWLFMSEQFAPLVEGKRVDANKLRTVKLTTEQGQERTVKSLILSARQLSEDDWRLYVYGTEKKPLIEAKFSEVNSNDDQALTLRIDDLQAAEGTLNVILFGKYKAGFKVGYRTN